MTGIGQELAAAREARGLALADVAQQLKFSPRQLEALEQEHFEVLPGATFARGMVRSYARLLKLDPEPLVQRIAQRFELPDANRLAARYHQPVPFSTALALDLRYSPCRLRYGACGRGIAYEWHPGATAAANHATDPRQGEVRAAQRKGATARRGPGPGAAGRSSARHTQDNCSRNNHARRRACLCTPGGRQSPGDTHRGRGLDRDQGRFRPHARVLAESPGQRAWCGAAAFQHHLATLPGIIPTRQRYARRTPGRTWSISLPWRFLTR